MGSDGGHFECLPPVRSLFHRSRVSGADRTVFVRSRVELERPSRDKQRCRPHIAEIAIDRESGDAKDAIELAVSTEFSIEDITMPTFGHDYSTRVHSSRKHGND